MGYYAEEYTCGSCKYYEYAGKNTQGYCNWYKAYYFEDDSCNHYDKRDGGYSSGSGCFITSACCEHKGLADDCVLMQKLRGFRDTYIKSLPDGEDVIKEYYDVAPGIVSAINAREDKDAVYEDIYSTLLKAEKMIDRKENEEAYTLYRDMVVSLKKTYTPDAG